MVAPIPLGFILRYSIGAAWGWEALCFASTWSAFDIGPLRITGLWLWLIFAAPALSLAVHFLLMNTKGIQSLKLSDSVFSVLAEEGLTTLVVFYNGEEDKFTLGGEGVEGAQSKGEKRNRCLEK